MKKSLSFLAVLVLLAGCGESTPDSQQASGIPDGQTTQRPGYEGSDYPDPAPLKEKPHAQAVQVGGKPVIQACNLLSLNDLTDLGVKVGSRPDPNVVNFKRIYLTGDGKGPLETSAITYSQAPGEALNECTYALESKDSTLQETLSVAVSQPAYVPSAAETAAAFVGAPASITLGAVHAYSKRRPVPEPDASGEAAVILGDTVASFDFDLKGAGNAGKLQDIAKRVMQNLEKQTNAPAGPSTVDYASPVFPVPVAQPCPLLTANTVTPAIGAETSPLVTETPGTAVGDIVFPHDPQQRNYVQITCERGTGEDDPLSRKALSLTATSFLTDDAAKQYVENTAGAHGGQAPSTAIGDESKIMTDTLSVKTRGVLIFRKGRFAFELNVDDHDAHPDGISLAEANTLLVPAGQKIARAFQGA
ncbi:hypothetical protein VSH64_41760 [Amycolatopsis rhabdoformis]|uniref:DUF3558 domain-containing protein n=1 Tax=Amycolatopsis rhabdoformis TaxID=1448059 RepID=A0ABZ1I6X9_9PSEU|nr:hypothetical protein [Amycolatopsis rhabdoformis]WSE29269.1 hypothetical protein VSH64_41760 [Amycolatopsis rhabdoformis]